MTTDDRIRFTGHDGRTVDVGHGRDCVAVILPDDGVALTPTEADALGRALIRQAAHATASAHLTHDDQPDNGGTEAMTPTPTPIATLAPVSTAGRQWGPFAVGATVTLIVCGLMAWLTILSRSHWWCMPLATATAIVTLVLASSAVAALTPRGDR